MDGLLATAEQSGASKLRALATALQALADRLDTSPLSATLSSLFTSRTASILSNNLSSKQLSSSPGLILTTLAASIAFVFLAPLVLNFVLDVNAPHLDTVPPPSAIYDPDLDPQADSFADDDVRPQLVASNTPAALRAVSPSTGSTIGYVAMHAPSEVARLVAAARAAQAKWRLSSFVRRRKVLSVVKDYVLYEQKSLCELSARDTGKTMVEASIGEIIPTLEKLRWLIAEGEAALRPERRSVGPLSRHKAAIVRFEPIGVIAAIAPWNYPLHNALNPISAALFAGCAIVLKPSEHATLSTLHYVRVVRRALSVCGESADLVQCLVGLADVGEALVSSPGIDKVFFTGSTAIGRQVAVAAAKRLVPTCLELGGKDALIVCDDANLAHVTPIAMRGTFQNSGQNCVGIERVFVHKDVKHQFVDGVLQSVERMRVGEDIGAMTMGEPAMDMIQQLVDDAVEKGAELLVGGKKAANRRGCYYEPTVLSGVTNKMRIAQEEVFGPVMTIFEWGDEAKMLQEVNVCPFALGSSVFTENSGTGERIMQQLQVGMCNINDFAINYLCQSMPFGGTRESGSDRFAGIEGLRGCCVTKSTTRDRFLGIRTVIPKALRYPVAENAFQFSSEINDLMYGKSIWTKLDNVRNLAIMTFFPGWQPRTVGSG